MKFKNIKKKSPNNSRNNPDVIDNFLDKTRRIAISLSKINSVKFFRLYGIALKVFFALVFTITAGIVGIDLKNNLQMKMAIDSQREELMRKIFFWEDFMLENDGYRDAYFQVSILEYELGDIAKAKECVEKGLNLDPTSEEGRKIEKFLN